MELTSSVVLPAGDYTVAVSGVELAEGKDKGSVTVAPERIEEVKLAVNGYRDASAPTTVKLAYTAYNQYGEDITTNFTKEKFAVTSNRGIITANEPSDKGVITVTGVSNDVTTLSLTLVDKTYGKTTTQTVNVRDSKALGSIELSQPVLKANKTSLEQVDTNVVIPHTAKNQFGEGEKLVVGTAAANGFTIISSDNTVVDPSDVKVDTVDGKAQLVIAKFGSFSGSKSVTLTAIANATGTSSKITFSVNGASVADAPVLVAPTSNPGKGENPVYVELKLTDNYGKEMKASDIVAAASGLTVVSGNTSKVSVNSQKIVEIDGKAYISLKAEDNGTANVTVTVNATGKSATLPITVVDAKVPAGVTVSTDANYAEVGGVVNLKFAFKDQYGNAIDTSTNKVTFTVEGTAFTGLTSGDKTVSELKDGLALKATANDKTFKIKAELKDAAGAVVSTQNITLQTIKSDDVLTYSIEQVPTLYGVSTNDKDSDHAVDLKLVGLLSGNKVALPKGYATFTSTNSAIKADTTDMKVWAVFPQGTPANVTETGTIALWQGATKLAETTVTAKSETPVITTATAEKAKITVDGLTKEQALEAIKANVEIKDQYGVLVTPKAGINGSWTSTKTTLTFTGDAIQTYSAGTSTVGFVTSNGKVVTFEVSVLNPAS
ncbi:hypothetical protein ABE021_13510 [Sporosarcina gallistercoris]|uniref:hypothetical protein n=1 Tax=Sporosarcina gallistercoris TaxID=2762245 RepID=UPI003D2B60CB